MRAVVSVVLSVCCLVFAFLIFTVALVVFEVTSTELIHVIRLQTKCQTKQGGDGLSFLLFCCKYFVLESLVFILLCKLKNENQGKEI